MAEIVAAKSIRKQQFRNDSGGWVGYVQLDAKGEAIGQAVAPGETIWLSEAEKQLTANAPRDPGDNPFVEQEHRRVDQTTGRPVTLRVTPLVPVTEERYVPASDRFVPDGQPETSVAPPSADEPAPPAASPGPPAPGTVRKSGGAVPSVETRTPDETAAAVDREIGEETGAALSPSEPPPEGEYAAHEEVGTPDAPQASVTPTMAGPPAPYSPQDR